MSSHIATVFNRLARLVTGKQDPDESIQPSVVPNRSPFIQTQALPPYMDKLYMRLRPSGNSKTLKPEKLQFSGLFGMAALDSQNKYVESFGRMHPYKAKQRLMQEGPLLTNPNLVHLPEQERKSAELSLATLLYYRGMDPEEYKFFTDYISKCGPDVEFIADENLKIAAIKDAVLSDNTCAMLINHMLPQRMHTYSSMPQQYYLRQRFMQEVADQIAIANNHPYIPVILDQFPAAFDHIGGWALHRDTVRMGVPATDIILINALPKTIDNVATMLNIVGHEMRHIMDRRLSTQAICSGLSDRDPNRIHACLVALNEAAYTNTPRGPKSQYTEQMAEQFNRYESQYMERGARQFGEKLEKSLTEALPEIFDPSFEVEKLCVHSMR